jgi:hypothetical protein
VACTSWQGGHAPPRVGGGGGRVACVAALVSHGSQHVHVTCQPASRHPSCPWLLRVVCVRRLCVWISHSIFLRAQSALMPSHTHTHRWLACCTAPHHRGHSSVTSPHVFSHLITLGACCLRRNACHTFASLPLLARHVKAPTHTLVPPLGHHFLSHARPPTLFHPSSPTRARCTRVTKHAVRHMYVHHACADFSLLEPAFPFIRCRARPCTSRALALTPRPHKRPLSHHQACVRVA